MKIKKLEMVRATRLGVFPWRVTNGTKLVLWWSATRAKALSAGDTLETLGSAKPGRRIKQLKMSPERAHHVEVGEGGEASNAAVASTPVGHVGGCARNREGEEMQIEEGCKARMGLPRRRGGELRTGVTAEPGPH